MDVRSAQLLEESGSPQVTCIWCCVSVPELGFYIRFYDVITVMRHLQYYNCVMSEYFPLMGVFEEGEI